MPPNQYMVSIPYYLYFKASLGYFFSSSATVSEVIELKTASKKHGAKCVQAQQDYEIIEGLVLQSAAEGAAGNTNTARAYAPFGTIYPHIIFLTTPAERYLSSWYSCGTAGWK